MAPRFLTSADNDDGVPDADLTTPGLQTTLRAALQFAESLNSAIPPTIVFANTVQNIGITTALPTITKPVNILGDSNENGVERERVKVRGNPEDATQNGLHFQNVQHAEGESSLIKGLEISNFGGNGLVIEKSNNLKIQANFFGFNGTDASANPETGTGGDGILIDSSDNIEIGGDATQGLGNVISANKGNGIHFVGTSPDSPSAPTNKVWGNIIGLDNDGVNGFGNKKHGIFIDDVSHIDIGQIGDDGRNIISGNGQVLEVNGETVHVGDGIRIAGQSTLANNGVLKIRVQNNFIGTDKNGFNAVGNQANGIHVTAGTRRWKLGRVPALA